MEVEVETQEDDAPLKTFDIFKDLSKPVRLSLHLIVKRNLPPEAERWSQDEIVKALDGITHLRLDRENINAIDSLELLGPNVKNVYLQQNKITQIENFDCLRGLKFLSLAGNCIEKVENLRGLISLRVLDLSRNYIKNIDTDELPNKLIILNLEHNPCTETTYYCEYREQVISCLPNLLQLDGDNVRRPEEDEEDQALLIEEDEEENSSSFPSAGNSDTDLHVVTGAMLLRSQDRVESSQERHEKHITELNDLRMKHNIARK